MLYFTFLANGNQWVAYPELEDVHNALIDDGEGSLIFGISLRPGISLCYLEHYSVPVES